MEKTKIWIVLPAHNEAQVLPQVLSKIKSSGYRNILVVDDGSRDHTSEVAQKNGAVSVRHFLNRGAGAATQTGILAALQLGAEIVVTMDSDGQHEPKEIQKLVTPIVRGECDVVIGSRFLEQNQIPFLRRIFNFIGNLITWFFFGLWVSDSQSGFKSFSRTAAERLKILTNGYEFCSEIIREIKVKKLVFKEVPITVRYDAYSLAKGQNFARGLTTLLKLFLRSVGGG
jgi:glycosyltransferase involved in cell wall biosynthesis